MKNNLEIVAVRYDKDMRPYEIIHKPDLNNMKVRMNELMAVGLADKHEIEEIKNAIRNRASNIINL